MTHHQRISIIRRRFYLWYCIGLGIAFICFAVGLGMSHLVYLAIGSLAFLVPGALYLLFLYNLPCPGCGHPLGPYALSTGPMVDWRRVRYCPFCAFDLHLEVTVETEA